MRSSTLRSARAKAPAVEDATLTIRWPWWVHPGWALLLLTGSMALAAASISPESYAKAWGVPKFLDGDSAGNIFICLLLLMLGVIFTSGMSARNGSTTIQISAKQVTYLKKACKWLIALTFIGYASFFLSGFLSGIGVGDLIAVMQRDPLATYRIKAEVKTIPGVTTMTQFGPIAVVIGFLLRRIGIGGKTFLWIVLLSATRVVFYSERLALIEVLVPLVLVWALTIDQRRARAVSLAPAVLVPLVWAVFAASEYFRSWVAYQFTTDVPFFEWVTLRLIGYYTTGFNNSALFAQAHEGTFAAPYFSVSAFWNAPGVSSIFPYPGIGGLGPDTWWSHMLAMNSSREFNNEGSFLVAWAELGPVGACAFWLVIGLLLGALFSSLTKGNIISLVAFCALFIGVLELPRIIYWTEGRAFPVIVALIVIACTYPRVKRGATLQGFSPAHQRLFEQRAGGQG